jgi:hypothetical protein
MSRGSFRKEIADLLGGLEGWRLEPRTTPGASPLWCFLSEGKIVFSVSAEGSAIALYVMDTDEELTFSSRDAFESWLGEHRPDALLHAPAPVERKQKVRRFFEWE